MWWKYYSLSSEPSLSQEPLNTEEELDLFYGREKEIQKLNLILAGRYKRTLLLTGNPGVGKTSLINKLYYGSKGYIHVDLSMAKQFEDAEVVIAASCIDLYNNHNKEKAAEYRRRIFSDISETVGDSLSGGIKPWGIGVEYADIFQTTIAPIRNIEVSEIIKDVLLEISKKEKICLVLDESDFFDENHTDDLIHLSRRIKDLLPPSSILVLINRDIDKKFENDYINTNSLVRATFNNLYHIESAWKQGFEKPWLSLVEEICLVSEYYCKFSSPHCFGCPRSKQTGRHLVSLSVDAQSRWGKQKLSKHYDKF